MAESKKKMREILTKLETERDELRVKLNLGWLEARDEWKDVEEKLDQLRGRMKVVGKEAGESSREVRAAFDLLAEEVKHGFEQIRKLI